MWKRIRTSKELAAGLIFAVAGAVFFFAAQHYRMGSATDMGPGYFPALLGMLLFLLGGAAIVKGLVQGRMDSGERHDLEPLARIMVGILAFAFLIERVGLLLTLFVCVFLACFRRALTHPLEVFLTYVALTVLSYAIFVLGFGMTIPLL